MWEFSGVKYKLKPLFRVEDSCVASGRGTLIVKKWFVYSFLTFLILLICSASDTDDNREVLMAGRNRLSIQEFASAIPNHLLLGSLLEHLCFVYESNPARSRMLFKGMYLEIV